MRTFQAEFLKLVTTRSGAGTLIGAMLVAIAAFVTPGENVVEEIGRPLHEQQSMFLIGFLLRVLLLVLGIRAITDETRHGTLTPSLLATPRRGRFLVAKTCAASVAGLITGIAVAATAAVTASLVARANDVGLEIGTSDAWTLAGIAAGGAIWPAIGVGFGTIAKSQLVATVAGLVWLMGLEEAVSGRLGDLAGYLPGEAGLALSIASSGNLVGRTSLILLAYAGVAVAGGILLLRRRDVGGAA